MYLNHMIVVLVAERPNNIAPSDIRLIDCEEKNGSYMAGRGVKDE